MQTDLMFKITSVQRCCIKDLNGRQKGLQMGQILSFFLDEMDWDNQQNVWKAFSDREAFSLGLKWMWQAKFFNSN